MKTLLLFTDGSVDVKTGIGYGAFLTVADKEIFRIDLEDKVKIRRFENTSSTRLELQTLICALSEIYPAESRIEIYTDSQNITGLPGRRKMLEENNYHSKNNRLVGNHDLYREFFNITSELDFELKKTKGHQPTRQKDEIHRLFTLVDKASRNALRKEFSNP
jgi:ribonuclease HI